MRSSFYRIFQHSKPNDKHIPIIYRGQCKYSKSLWKGFCETEILQDDLGAHSLKETLNFETEDFKGEDKMDKLDNNSKMLLRNGEPKGVVKAGYNVNIA